MFQLIQSVPESGLDTLAKLLEPFSGIRGVRREFHYIKDDMALSNVSAQKSTQVENEAFQGWGIVYFSDSEWISWKFKARLQGWGLGFQVGWPGINLQSTAGLF